MEATFPTIQLCSLLLCSAGRWWGQYWGSLGDGRNEVSHPRPDQVGHLHVFLAPSSALVWQCCTKLHKKASPVLQELNLNLPWESDQLSISKPCLLSTRTCFLVQLCKICLKSPCTASTALLALIEVQGLWDSSPYQKRSSSQTISSLGKLLFYLLAIVLLLPSLEKLTLSKCCMAAAQ